MQKIAKIEIGTLLLELETRSNGDNVIALSQPGEVVLIHGSQFRGVCEAVLYAANGIKETWRIAPVDAKANTQPVVEVLGTGCAVKVFDGLHELSFNVEGALLALQALGALVEIARIKGLYQQTLDEAIRGFLNE